MTPRIPRTKGDRRHEADTERPAMSEELWRALAPQRAQLADILQRLLSLHAKSVGLQAQLVALIDPVFDDGGGDKGSDVASRGRDDAT